MLENIPEIFADINQALKDTARKTNLAFLGNGNNSGEVTLTPDSDTTVIADRRISVFSCIVFMSKTANAAIALQTLYVTIEPHSATIHHANNSQTDRTYRFAITGS